MHIYRESGYVLLKLTCRISLLLHRFIIDEVLIICTHIKKLFFLNKKLLKYNLKLIYLIIKKIIKTQFVTQFLIKLKLPKYVKTSSIVK